MVKAIPDGYTSVTPYLIVKDARAQIAFLKKAFDATAHFDSEDPDGRIGHADMVVFGSHVMLAQSTEQFPAMPAMVHLYVADVDAIYARAVEAGGTPYMPVQDHFYGDRSGGVTDSNGNIWWISTHREDVPPDELEHRMKQQYAKDK